MYKDVECVFVPNKLEQCGSQGVMCFQWAETGDMKWLGNVLEWFVWSDCGQEVLVLVHRKSQKYTYVCICM